MNLTSYNRLLRYLAASGDANVTAARLQERDLIRWIAPISNRIEKYCGRLFGTSAAITEYFDVTYGRREYFIERPPVTTVTSVYYDSTGLWTGSETEIVDCYPGTNGRSVCLPTSLLLEVKRGIRIIYAGGIAADGVKSTYAISTSAGTWHTAKYVKGSTSLAMGYITTASATSITAEVLYGQFESGETITEMDTEDSVGTADAVATISSVTASALCEQYPDIALAAEMQIRYMSQHKMNFENTGFQKDGTTTRGYVSELELPLQPEVISILSPYKRPAIAM